MRNICLLLMVFGAILQLVHASEPERSSDAIPGDCSAAHQSIELLPSIGGGLTTEKVTVDFRIVGGKLKRVVLFRLSNEDSPTLMHGLRTTSGSDEFDMMLIEGNDAIDHSVDLDVLQKSYFPLRLDPHSSVTIVLIKPELSSGTNGNFYVAPFILFSDLDDGRCLKLDLGDLGLYR